MPSIKSNKDRILEKIDEEIKGISRKLDGNHVRNSYDAISLAGRNQSIVVSVKRFHDTNRSGWHILLGLISAGIYLLIVCGFFKGTDGENKYGDPSSLIEKDSFDDSQEGV